MRLLLETGRAKWHSPVIVILLLVLTAWALPDRMSDDEADIRAAVENYFTGVTDNNLETLETAFHPQALIWSALPNGYLYRTDFYNWKRFTGRDPSPESSRYQNRIVSVDQEGSAAVVKVDMIWPNIRYFDFLSMVKHEGQWVIVTKIWHQQDPPG